MPRHNRDPRDPAGGRRGPGNADIRGGRVPDGDEAAQAAGDENRVTPGWPGAVGWVRTEAAADGEWVVRTVPGAGARKLYRCPGCDHEIRPGVAHVVAWSAGGAGPTATDARRHWHTACWTARLSRRPGR